MTQKSSKHFSLRKWLRENPHAYWTLAVLPIVAIYLIPEQLVVNDYWATQLAIDGLIPFVPEFVVFYLLWFPCLFFVGLWLMIQDGQGYRRYICYLLAAYAVAMVIYLCFPNGQDLRPTLDAPHGICEKILAMLYAFDTNTNVLPSLHVVGAIGFTAAALDTKTIRHTWVKGVICVLAVLISVSTVFVKQHAVLDVLAGVLMGAVLHLIIYRMFRRRESRADERKP